MYYVTGRFCLISTVANSIAAIIVICYCLLSTCVKSVNKLFEFEKKTKWKIALLKNIVPKLLLIDIALLNKAYL